jgi:hypothetical protein
MQIFISKKIILFFCIFLMSVTYFKWQAQDDRPIKFENYNDQEFQKVIQEKFRVGDFIGIAIAELASSKINEMIFTEITDDYKQMYSPNARYSVHVEYKAPIFSLSPLASYEVYFSADKNLNIVFISARKTKFIEYFWW